MILFKKEKEVVDLVNTFLASVDECLATAEASILAYLNADLKEAKLLARQVRELETRADVGRYDVRNKLYTGAYLPGMREDIYNIVESIDKVANAAEACCDFFLNQRPIVYDHLKPHFEMVVRETFGIGKSLKQAVSCFFNSECPLDEIRQYTQQVGLIESDVDKSEWDLTKIIFTSSIDHCYKLHLRSCLGSIVEISDRAEDAADLLELAALKAMT